MTHIFDANTRLLDARDRHEMGTTSGDACGRYHEPDEDAPRGYRPKPCPGVITEAGDGVECDTCGERI